MFVLDRSDSIVGPGLVDPHVTVGAMGRTGENGASILPNMSATELLNAWHSDYERAVRAGVTTVVLAPGETHLIGGVTAVAKTAGDAASRLIGDGPLKISLTRNAFNLFRTPTSLQGGLAELRIMIAAAKAKDSDESAFAKWARGESPALVEVDDDAALTSLALFAKEQGVRCIALHANLAAERLDAVQMLDLPVILGTYEFSDPRRYTRAPGMLGKAGVPVALTSNAPRYAPEWLRYGAAIELRQGASRELVQRSISTTAAEIAGVANRVGSIAEGMDADLVIYSGDPLALRSRILEVFVNGERVFVADEPPAMPEDDDA
jgi:imidazolonepropionase-like amidohydrolase